jgi:hypothetical protein
MSGAEAEGGKLNLEDEYLAEAWKDVSLEPINGV